MAVLQALALAAAVLATVGLLTRITLPLAWLAALPLVAMTSSLGKVVHNDVPLLLCPVPLLPSWAGAAWSLDARQPGARPRAGVWLAGADGHGGGRRGLLLLRPEQAAARRARAG